MARASPSPTMIMARARASLAIIIVVDHNIMSIIVKTARQALWFILC